MNKLLYKIILYPMKRIDCNNIIKLSMGLAKNKLKSSHMHSMLINFKLIIYLTLNIVYYASHSKVEH